MSESITIPNGAVRAYMAGIAAWDGAERKAVLGRLKAGEHWSEAVRLSMESVEEGRAAMRAACVANIAGLLSVQGKAADVVNEAIGCWWAYRLLHLDGGYGTTPRDTIPAYWLWRHGWSHLVQRNVASDGGESWSLLAGIEETCKAAYAEGREWSWRESDQCPGVQMLIATAVADHAAMIKREKDQKAKQLVAQHDAQLELAASAQTQAERKAAKQTADTLAKELKLAESAAEKAADDADKAAAKADKAIKKPQAPPAPPAVTWRDQAIAAAAKASIVDLDELIWDMLAVNGESEYGLYLLLQTQDKDADCSSTFRAAFAAFSVVWTRKSKQAA